MSRRSLLAGVVALALVPAPASAAGGELAEQCAPLGSPATVMCYGGDVLVRDGQAYAQPDRFEQAIRDYESSWTHRALRLQYALADDVGFTDAPWLGTHNSFNSIAQQGAALSTTDANQQLSLTDQLRIDVRSLELDVHWFPSARAGGQEAAVVCHAGAASDHDGCSTEPLLGPVLDQVAGWMREHPRQVLLLYIEHHLAGGYDSAAATISESLGSLVYGTGSAGGECVELPGTLTRRDVLDAGAQIVIVGNCGDGAPYRSLGFSWNDHHESGPAGFEDFPGCGPSYSREDYDTRLIRYFEDSTWLSAGADALGGGEGVSEGLTPAVVGAMARCGVDLFGFDQVTPDDGRLDAAVWSWAKGQPRRGSCAVIGSDGRWRASGCERKRPVACRAGDTWLVSAREVAPDRAAKECEKDGAVFDVPRTGYENELLKAAAGGTVALLGYTRAGGWTPATAR